MSTALMLDSPTLYVVEHEAQVLRELRRLDRLMPLEVETTAAEDLLAACDPTRAGAVFLDLDLPESSGLPLLGQLAEAHVFLPVIVASSDAAARAAVDAMKAGAHDFLAKPCGPAEIEAAVRDALDWDARHREEIALCFAVHRRMKRLSPCERMVLDRVIRGISSRELAAEMGRCVSTVEQRRSSLMRKMKAKSATDLVRLALIERYFGIRPGGTLEASNGARRETG